MTPQNEGLMMMKIMKVEEHIGRFVDVVRWFLIREDKRREDAIYDHQGLPSPHKEKETPR